AIESDLLYSFRRSPVTVTAASVVVVIVLAAVLAPWITPQNPFDLSTVNLMDGFTPPLAENQFTGNRYLLGTDAQGRAMYSAILYGARISLFVGVMAVAFAAVLGVSLGLLAGYVGGWLDTVIMRVADVQLSFPAILIALMIFGVARGFVPPAHREEMAIW